MTIGTCSICGGPVMIPDVWYSTIPPIPTCGRCGARKRDPYGPVVEMSPAVPSATPDQSIGPEEEV